jgi:hypothetical protein
VVAQGGLTEVEAALVEYVRRGEKLDLIPSIPEGKKIDQDKMRSWCPCQTISATVIRDILRGRRAADPDPHGLRLRGARISGRLHLENLHTEVNLELTDCLLGEGVVAREAHMASVSLRGCLLEHPAKSPLDAAGLACGLLDLRGATIIGHDDDKDGGAVRLLGAHISGHLDCTGASIYNDKGPALIADGVQVDLGMFLRYGFSATGVGKDGAVLLRGASVGIHLVCSRAYLHNDKGPALFADGLRVAQNMYMDDVFTATGAGASGAVRLSAARIGGSLECDGAHLCNKSGPALYANRLEVGQVINLGKGFTATSGNRGPNDDDLGAVHLTGAQIGGSLHCEEAHLRNESGSALVADSLQTGRGIYLHKGFTATSRGDGVAVNLVRAQAGGTLFFDQAGFHAADLCHRLDVDGLTYAGVPSSDKQPDADKQSDADEQPDAGQCWLCLLRHGTPAYAAQPYQHLAAGFRALGDDKQARETLIAQRDDQLARGETSRWEKPWGKITWYTLGYGYKPWRAVWGLAVVLVVSCVLAVTLGSLGALAQTDKTPHRGQACTFLQKASVGLDLNLPIGKSLARDHCDLAESSASTAAATLTAASWVLQLLAWAFAALFVAGFTSAVRKT